MKPRLLLLGVLVCGACASKSGASAPAQSSAATSIAAPSASAAPSVAQPQSPPLPASFDVAAIDAYITGQIAAHGFVGLSVAIAKDGVIVLEKGYGMRQLSPSLPVLAETPFEVGSITKQFVAALVLQLSEEKKLSLEDPVAKYFPDLTRATDITLYDLMTHVSGYRDNYPLDFVDEEMKKPIDPDEAIARYAKRPLDFEPRTRFSYSSTGYKILGRVVEKVTGQALAVALEERILRPLGMTHSSYTPVAGAEGIAQGYTSFALGPPTHAEPEGRGWAFGAGGLYAPAGDIARWSLALMGGKVLDAAAYATFHAPRHLADGGVSMYGCGIRTSLNRNGDEVLQHTGMDAGFVGWSLMIPRTKTVVVVLSNRDDAPPWDLMNDVVGLLNKSLRPPSVAVVGAPAKDVAKEMFAAMQAGTLDRARLGDDFNLFLTDEKLHGAAARLATLGAPTDVQITSTQDRGGMEQTTALFTFAAMKLEAVMFRSVDGKVQQFLVHRP